MPDLKDKEYSLEIEKKTAFDKKQEAKEIPVYMERLELTEDQKKAIIKEYLEEYDVLEEQRKLENLEQKWQALDNQYEGKIQEDARRQFNLNRKITKIKINKCTNLIMQAFFESDPIYAVSPRPEYDKEGGREVCDKQQDFLDYKLDNLPFRFPIGLTVHSSGVKGTGILKMYHDIKRVKRQREERYNGKLEPIRGKASNQPIMGKDGQPVMENRGLIEFLKNWPKAPEDYPGLVKKLMEGKEITIMADYWDTVYNDPRPKCIDLKNFRIRTDTDGYEGLKTTKLIDEIQSYSYWDLKREEAAGKFFDIDKLIEDKDGVKKKNYAKEDYIIHEATMFVKLKESDKDDIRIVFWIDEEKHIIIGAERYRYNLIDSIYVPFYINMKKPGCFYQPGMAEDLTDTNLAENLILNLSLEAAYIQNTVTPITDDEDVESQFLEKRFAHGVPIRAKVGTIDFLQKYMRPSDMNGLIGIMQYLIQTDDDVTGISSLMSGRESPIDPSAPASKTIALLEQSGISVKDYIMTISQSFNEVGYILLNMYYQISKEGRKYAINPERVVGNNPFATLERNEMAARTNIQTRAYAFDFDKVNEKKADVSLYQMVRMEPIIARRPESVYMLLKNIITAWSPKWKNALDQILPPLEQFKKEQAAVALQAVVQYVQAKKQEEATTGVQAEFKAEELVPMINDLIAQIATPVDEKVQKEQEKNAQ